VVTAPIAADATALFIFEHSLIPGIFQTPEYARAVLEAHPNITEEEVSERVAARLARQDILEREDPPAPVLWVLLDQNVLHREVGGLKVMRDQLTHLARMSRCPNITIQVIPLLQRKICRCRQQDHDQDHIALAACRPRLLRLARAARDQGARRLGLPRNFNAGRHFASLSPMRRPCSAPVSLRPATSLALILIALTAPVTPASSVRPKASTKIPGMKRAWEPSMRMPARLRA
jgi:hypothetical protein